MRFHKFDAPLKPGQVTFVEAAKAAEQARNEYDLDLHFHAFNYRNAMTGSVQAEWVELEKCVNRKIEAAVQADRLLRGQ